MELVYTGPGFAVIRKPVGMDSEHDIPEALKAQLHTQVYPIHRLDKNVGGLMVYAASRSAAAELSRAVQDGTLVKEYYAVIHGSSPEDGDWEDFLFKDSAKNKVFVVKKERRGVKKARLTFRTLSRTEDTSLVKIRLCTGRTHQIRVQFASRGFPLVGDKKYGAKDAQSAPMLFSCALTFPFGGKEFHFEARPDWVPAQESEKTL